MTSGSLLEPIPGATDEAVVLRMKRMHREQAVSLVSGARLDLSEIRLDEL